MKTTQKKPLRAYTRYAAMTALGTIMSVASVYAETKSGEVYSQDSSAQKAAQTSQAGAHNAGTEAKESGNELTGASRNAWLHGKLETSYLLNRHLNNFRINSKVMDGTAYLEGTVESEIDSELAEEVALGIKGISRVENNLKVDRANARAARGDFDHDAEGRTFAQRIGDATTTAVVKSKLLANGQTEGFNINVDTHSDVVTLRGQVGSSEESALAEQLATNTNDVKSVVNELVIEKDDT